MISCNQYDYIEIACMYRMPLVLTYKNGFILKCNAKDTLRNKHGQECMLVVQEKEDVMVVLGELQSMQANIENPHFDLIEFNN